MYEARGKSLWGRAAALCAAILLALTVCVRGAYAQEKTVIPLGSGGMVTKLNAAVIATSAGCEMVIANGSKPDLLYDIAQGKPVGTRFLKRKVV